VGHPASGNVYCTTLTSEQLLLSKLASPSSESLMLMKYCPGSRPAGSRNDTSWLSPEPLTILTADVYAEAVPWHSVASTTVTLLALMSPSGKSEPLTLT